MIRTVQQWLESPQFEALAKGGTLAAFIEAVQRDAVEACYGRCVEEGQLAKESSNESALAMCNWIGQRIRALIPPKPEETA